MLKADGPLLVRMLENLIRNAYRYGREQGRIRVSLKESGGEIRLTVADDGIGMAEEELSRIWSRFYRVDQSRSRTKGAGLGLGRHGEADCRVHGGRWRKSESGGAVSYCTFNN